MKKTVGVALASFNGIRYIRQQLESICSQSLAPDLICVSDDGSNDGTKEFLLKFSEHSKVPMVLIFNDRRLGVIENFMQAFSRCDTDYIAYCDQDDVWLPERIASCMSVVDDRNAALVFHRSEIVDSDLHPLGRFEPFNVGKGIYRFPHFPDGLWGFGHQMIFSKQVFSMMKRIKECKAEELAPVASCFDISLLVAAGMVGDIYFIDRALLRFRRHADSVSTAGKSQSSQTSLARTDLRKERVATTARIIETLLREIGRGSLQLDGLASDTQTYAEHMRVMLTRYTIRLILYQSGSFFKRLQAFHYLIASNSFGSVKSNKLSLNQLLIDGSRTFFGGRKAS